MYNKGCSLIRKEVAILKNENVVIKALTVEDAQIVLDYFKQVTFESKNLLRELDEFTLTLEDEQSFLSKNNASKNEYIAGAFIGDKLIATAGFHGSNLRRISHRVSIGISVLKAHQNKGVGSMLMAHIIEMAKAYHKQIIELDVRSDNLSVIALYKKFGFVEIGSRRNGFFVDDKYVDLLLMDKTL